MKIRIALFALLLSATLASDTCKRQDIQPPNGRASLRIPVCSEKQHTKIAELLVDPNFLNKVAPSDPMFPLTLDRETLLAAVPEEDWLVMFHVDWCGHCQDLLPKFQEWGPSMLKTIKTATFSCSESPKVCSELGIHSYPALMLFHESHVIRYRGKREQEALETYSRWMTRDPAEYNSGFTKVFFWDPTTTSYSITQVTTLSSSTSTPFSSFLYPLLWALLSLCILFTVLKVFTRGKGGEKDRLIMKDGVEIVQDNGYRV